MASMNLAMEIFEAIEGEVGHDRALKVAKAVDTVIVRIEEKAVEHSFARKAEIKDELKKELRDELATKADLADVRAELKTDIANVRVEIVGLRSKMNLHLMVVVFAIIITNPQALQLLGRMLGLLK